MSSNPKGVPALRLTLGGAPLTPHQVEGLPGFYRPHAATPVGGAGECPLELAKKAAADAGAPVELVEISRNEAKAARVELAEIHEQSRGAVLARRRDAVGAEVTQVQDEVAALSAGGTEAQ